MQGPIITNPRLVLHANLEVFDADRMETDEGLPFKPAFMQAEYEPDETGAWFLAWVQVSGPAIRKDGTVGTVWRGAYWQPNWGLAVHKWAEAPGWLVASVRQWISNFRHANGW